VSKKTSEFERYDRMKKLQKEAEVEKRKSVGGRKKGGRPKMQEYDFGKGKFRYEEDYEDYDEDLLSYIR
jgi:hypothetical protein